MSLRTASLPEKRSADGSASRWLIWSALWTVYIVWGSTYLAIRVVVETLPPLLSASVRFMTAGALMYAWLAVRGGRRRVRLRPAKLAASAFVGTALLLGGNGLVTIAEQSVPSGLAALIIASVPLWVVLLRRLFGEHVNGGTVVGVLVGFAGVAILALSGGSASGAAASGIGLLILASVSWASGSFLSRKVPLPHDPFVSTAVQMLTGGAIMGVAAAANGEFVGLDPASFSVSSLLALAYLVVAGSLLAFTAYTWLLRNAPISKVSTYAYVNPVVAVFLGWIILSEDVTATILVGAVVIVASVAFIVRHEATRPAKAGTPDVVQPDPTSVPVGDRVATTRP